MAEGIGTCLALFGATNFIGNIIGAELTGTAIQGLGMTPTLVLGGLVGLVAAGLVLLLRRPDPLLSPGPAVELASSERRSSLAGIGSEK